MMTMFQGLVLGLLQGLTEFLPVSSSGHQIILTRLMGWEFPIAELRAFSAVTQIGTELAVLVYFRSQIIQIVKVFVLWFFKREVRNTADAKMAWAVVLGSLPIGIVGYGLRHVVENDVSSLWLIAGMLVLFGVVLIVVEGAQRQPRDFDLGSGVLMGIAQTLALIPGVSRSGATISMGLWLGLERRVAARYSFLLAVPAVLASGFLEAFSMDTSVVPWGPTLVATGVSFLVGLSVIAGLLDFLQHRSFAWFGWYRVALGSALLVALSAGLLN